MNEHDRYAGSDAPRHLVGGYADSELTAAERRQVENLLSGHPEAIEDLEAQRRLAPSNRELWQEMAVPIPSEAKWGVVWRRIEEATRISTGPGRRPSKWWKRGLFALALAIPSTAAASIALLVSLTAPPRVVDTPETRDEVFPVALPGDIEIDSVRHSDREKLVVGEPPLTEALTLVAAGDVSLDNVQPDRGGAMPQVQMGETDVPIVFAPGMRGP